MAHYLMREWPIIFIKEYGPLTCEGIWPIIDILVGFGFHSTAQYWD